MATEREVMDCITELKNEIINLQEQPDEQFNKMINMVAFLLNAYLSRLIQTSDSLERIAAAAEKHD